MTDYGTDISTFPTLDTSFSLMTGRRVVAEAIARRLSTPRGKLFWDRSAGTDLRGWLNDDLDPVRSPMAIGIAVEAECLKDERVAGAQVAVSFDVRTRTLRVRIALELIDGDSFSMVLGVDQVTVELLEAA
jgi:hypothetical protein